MANRYGRLVDERKQNEEKYRIYAKKEECEDNSKDDMIDMTRENEAGRLEISATM